MCQRGPPPVLSSGLGALSPPALGREAVVGSAGPRGGGPLTAGAPCKQGRQPLWPLPRVPSCLCPEGPAPRSGWDCAVRRREAVGEENGRGVARDGSADAVRRRGALREESGAVERDGEARARKKSVGFVLKTGREKGPLGKGPSLASLGQGSPRARRAASGCAGRLGAGRTSLRFVVRAAAGAPCKQGRQPLWPLPRVPSCLCPEGPAPRSGWDCAVRRREAVGEENGRGVARDGSADAVRRRGALREESGAVERDGEARARKKSVGFVLKTGREKGPLGKGPSLASPGQGSPRARRAASGCAGRLGAGRTSL
ncbi:uncharacterized protein LOC116791068 [Chiroxiphia lanceolata]|uniref:uncharacterized protein LOC116791068 n=1 Tax=Chiroxiphia lanceolata TaxID=296741 RepID=UPI0013CE6227|nr:uncharacterized protein LOC116791068 [Chiroxiphia lanceolata]